MILRAAHAHQRHSRADCRLKVRVRRRQQVRLRVHRRVHRAVRRDLCASIIVYTCFIWLYEL